MVCEPFCFLTFGLAYLLVFLYQVNFPQDKGIYAGGDIFEKLNVLHLLNSLVEYRSVGNHFPSEFERYFSIIFQCLLLLSLKPLCFLLLHSHSLISSLLFYICFFASLIKGMSVILSSTPSFFVSNIKLLISSYSFLFLLSEFSSFKNSILFVSKIWFFSLEKFMIVFLTCSFIVCFFQVASFSLSGFLSHLSYSKEKIC